MTRKLDNKVAIVTGAGRGIGRSVALKLASEGARIIVNDLEAEPCAAVAAEIAAAGGTAIAHPGSVTAAGFGDGVVKAALEACGDLHIIVNNAGYTWDALIHKMTENQFDAMIDVHLKAPWRILQAAAEVFRVTSKAEQAAGRRVVRKVVNVSSIAGSRGNAGQTNYASAKAGVIGLTQTLAKEWGRHNVTVNCVAFGLIETRLTEATDEKKAILIGDQSIPVGVPVAGIEAITRAIPLGRGGSVEEAAGAIALFCYPESDYISGQLIEVTGGL